MGQCVQRTWFTCVSLLILVIISMLVGTGLLYFDKHARVLFWVCRIASQAHAKPSSAPVCVALRCVALPVVLRYMRTRAVLRALRTAMAAAVTEVLPPKQAHPRALCARVAWWTAERHIARDTEAACSRRCRGWQHAKATSPVCSPSLLAMAYVGIACSVSLSGS